MEKEDVSGGADGILSIDGAFLIECRADAASAEIPVGVAEIVESAFMDCAALESVSIPEGVRKIGAYAFWGCVSLKSVEIPDSVTEIETCAFNGCKSLASVTLGAGIKEIGVFAFDGCTSLSSIVYRGTTAQWLEVDAECEWAGNAPADEVSCSDGFAETGSVDDGDFGDDE